MMKLLRTYLYWHFQRVLTVENVRAKLTEKLNEFEAERLCTEYQIDDWILERLREIINSDEKIEELIGLIRAKLLKGERLNFGQFTTFILDELSRSDAWDVMYEVITNTMPELIEKHLEAGGKVWHLVAVAITIAVIMGAAAFYFIPVAKADMYTASKACVRVSSTDGIGSGIVVGADNDAYYALTNAHVATENRLKCEFFDASKSATFTGIVVMRNANLDLAVLKIDTAGKYHPTIIPVDPSYKAKKGDVLSTFGHPLGKYPTAYFCTYLGRNDSLGVCFTPPPAQGRSGSPLLDPEGSRVVGIVYGYTTADKVGLAIPADVVARYVEGAVTGRKVTETWAPRREGVTLLGTGNGKISILTNPPETTSDTPETKSGKEPEQATSQLPKRPAVVAEFSMPPFTVKTTEIPLLPPRGAFRDRIRQIREAPRRQPPRFFPPGLYPAPAPQGTPQSTPKPAPQTPELTREAVTHTPAPAVTLTQYRYPFQYEPIYGGGSCPGGNCPTTPIQNQKPKTPGDIQAPPNQKPKIEIVKPTPENPAPTAPQSTPAEPQIDETRKTLPQAVEGGIQAGIQGGLIGIADKVTVEIGDDIKSTLSTGTVAVAEFSAAVAQSAAAFQEATDATVVTLNSVEQSLAELKTCTQYAQWGLIILAVSIPLATIVVFLCLLVAEWGRLK